MEGEVMARTKFDWVDGLLFAAKSLCNVLLAGTVGYLWYSGSHAVAIGAFTYLVLDALDNIRSEVKK